MPERFTTKQHNGYIELYDYGRRICSCDNRREVDEEIHMILGY